MKQGDTSYDETFWNERYSGSEYSYGEEPNQFLKEKYEIFKPTGSILCLSEGEGRNAVFLASKKFQVKAVDLSFKAREKALKLAEKENVHIEYDVANLKDYPLGTNQWDGVVSISGHLPSLIRRRLHTSIKNSLRKDGIFLLEGYSTRQLQYDSGGPKNIDMLFSKEELEKDFSEFSILHSQEIIKELNEGSFHQGKASVVQFIARK